MVTPQEGQDVLAGLAKVPSNTKDFVTRYIAGMTAK